jgi:L-2-hydroxyglutarate oxidase
MSSTRFDIAIVGGGILGLATALELSASQDISIVVLETERRLAQHQTAHNSGVIHSGLYYKPGSLKARNCFDGRRRLLEFCDEHGIAYDICGKLVIATRRDEIPRLDELELRSQANGLEGVERVDERGIKEHEPHASGIDGLWVPETGIIDYVEVSERYAAVVREGGHEIRPGHRVEAVHRLGARLIVTTSRDEIECGYLVNCGGLQCDRVARLCGVTPDIRIVPFRGEYFELVEGRRDLVKGLIYPVPDPEFPFLGVHLTRGMDGTVEAGPNAVLALRREGYKRTSFSIADTVSSLSYPGFWKMAAKNWRVAAQEIHRSGSRRLFAESLQRFVPEIRAADLGRPGAGVRAQALDKDGKLLDDFHIVEAERMIHVLNAPSPGATASLSIGETIAQKAIAHFELG